MASIDVILTLIQDPLEATSRRLAGPGWRSGGRSRL